MDRFGESTLPLFRLRRKPVARDVPLTVDEWLLFRQWYGGELSDEQLATKHGMDLLERFQAQTHILGRGGGRHRGLGEG